MEDSENEKGLKAVLVVNEGDNVVTCVRPFTAGEVIELEGGDVLVKDDVASFENLALFAIRKGDLCFSYGRVIGRAARDIESGAPVHPQDLESAPPEIEDPSAGGRPRP